jgi:hypothetical protein
VPVGTPVEEAAEPVPVGEIVGPGADAASLVGSGVGFPGAGCRAGVGDGDADPAVPGVVEDS